MRRYLALREAYGTKKFSFKEAEKVLEDDARITNLCLSALRKNGWLESEADPQDARKKMYSLLDLEKVYSQITKEAIKNKNG